MIDFAPSVPVSASAPPSILPPAPPGKPVPAGAIRLALLMRIFNLSLTDVCAASGRTVSRSQLHRILHGQTDPMPAERGAIAVGLVECLKRKCTDSAFLFAENNLP